MSMSKQVPVYELTLSLGTETFEVLTTSLPKVWKYGEYVTDYDAKPVGYLAPTNTTEEETHD